MGPLCNRKGSICAQGRCGKSTASVFSISKIKKSRGDGIYERELLNNKEREELEGPNVDLRSRKEETYGCRVATEGRHICLVKPG